MFGKKWFWIIKATPTLCDVGRNKDCPSQNHSLRFLLSTCLFPVFSLSLHLPSYSVLFYSIYRKVYLHAHSCFFIQTASPSIVWTECSSISYSQLTLLWLLPPSPRRNRAVMSPPAHLLYKPSALGPREEPSPLHHFPIAWRGTNSHSDSKCLRPGPSKRGFSLLY